MPATNWREITYSRAHLRPNDGHDPEVSSLRTKSRTLAKTGKVHNYEKAWNLKDQYESRTKSALEKLKKDELIRQEGERKQLFEALKMREADFHALWEHKRTVMLEHLEERKRAFMERSQGQREALQIALNKEPMPPVKYSSTVRDEGIIEKKFANAGNFDYAIRYNKSLASLKAKEEEAHAKRWNESRQLRIDRLEERLKVEEKDMVDACDRERLRWEFQHKVAIEAMKQNSKNLTNDVDHALANEFAQKREVRKSLTAGRAQPKSYMSRPESHATFFGRLMMERVGKGSLDVPSVCMMHWGIQEQPRFADEGKKKKRPATSGH